jgi:predicted phage-related endonuclease
MPRTKKEVAALDVATDFREMYTQEHEQVLDEIYEKEIAISSMTKDIKPLKKFIQGYIGGFAGLLTGKYRASYKKETATSFDTKSFQKDNPKLYEQYLKTTHKRRWLLDKR